MHVKKLPGYISKDICAWPYKNINICNDLEYMKSFKPGHGTQQSSDAANVSKLILRVHIGWYLHEAWQMVSGFTILPVVLI